MILDQDACYRALCTRDRRWDGKFYTAVRAPVFTAGRSVRRARQSASIACSCRAPCCPAARIPPVPALPARACACPRRLGGEYEAIARALRLLADGFLVDANTEALADKLGVSARHLRRCGRRSARAPSELRREAAGRQVRVFLVTGRFPGSSGCGTAGMAARLRSRARAAGWRCSTMRLIASCSPTCVRPTSASSRLSRGVCGGCLTSTRTWTRSKRRLPPIRC